MASSGLPLTMAEGEHGNERFSFRETSWFQGQASLSLHSVSCWILRSRREPSFQHTYGTRAPWISALPLGRRGPAGALAGGLSLGRGSCPAHTLLPKVLMVSDGT